MEEYIAVGVGEVHSVRIYNCSMFASHRISHRRNLHTSPYLPAPLHTRHEPGVRFRQGVSLSRVCDSTATALQYSAVNEYLLQLCTSLSTLVCTQRAALRRVEPPRSCAGEVQVAEWPEHCSVQNGSRNNNSMHRTTGNIIRFMLVATRSETCTQSDLEGELRGKAQPLALSLRRTLSGYCRNTYMQLLAKDAACLACLPASLQPRSRRLSFLFRAVSSLKS